MYKLNRAQLLRVRCSVGRRESMRVYEGRIKGALKSRRDINEIINEGAQRGGERGGCLVIPHLSYG